jgi:hypothetical protein
MSIAEFQVHATLGGAQVCSGGTAYATSSLGGYAPQYAFDGSLATAWAGAASENNAMTPLALLYYDLGEGNSSAAVEYSIGSRSDSDWGQTPVIHEFWGSNDGVNWFKANPNISTPWTQGETQTFKITFGVPNSPGVSVTNTYTASGTIAVTDELALIDSSAAVSMSLANGSVDGKIIYIKRYGSGAVTLTADMDGTSGDALTLSTAECLQLAWQESLGTYLILST